MGGLVFGVLDGRERLTCGLLRLCITSCLAAKEPVPSNNGKSPVVRLSSGLTKRELRGLARQIRVAGNALMQMLDRGEMRLHYLDHYVVKRDPSGNVSMLRRVVAKLLQTQPDPAAPLH